ncbi:MAG: hypothetical protein LLG09_04705 [Negativicutes bacterium]|nr:hypothetical protein [Negativicutes bacterium]
MQCQTIDFCEDNLRTVAGAAQTAENIKTSLQNTPLRFYTQRCINACRPCHRSSLILRLNDELIEAGTNEEIMDKILKKISQSACENS